MEPAKPSSIRREVAGICVLLAALVFIVYGQTAHFGFVNYDDEGYINDSPETMKGLTPAGVLHAFTRKEAGLWNPLVTISHMLDCQLYGLNAGGHHLTNVLLHLASVILLFFILRQMTGATWRSAFVAALFAIHPLNVESVAWVSERKDVLSGLFFMLTLWAYQNYVRRPASWGRYLAVVLLFACGLMCKAMLVTLPFVLLLLDYWPLDRLFLTSQEGKFAVNRRAIVEKIPLLALSLGLCVVTMLGSKEQGSAKIEVIPFWTRMCEAPVTFVIYLGQMILPSGLAVVYPHPEDGLAWWPAALALLLLLSWGIFTARRNHPWLWMGWLWNFGMLMPVCGIVQISRHSQADHYNYLPQIGLYAGLTWMAAAWAGPLRRRRVALGGAGVVLLCFLTAAACRQAACWRDGVALWTHALECTKGNFIARCNLALALHWEGRIDEAIAQYREALDLDPTADNARTGLAVALMQKGLTKESAALDREILRGNPNNDDILDNLGYALFQMGRTDEAVASYLAALKIKPGFAKAHSNLGVALIKQGRADAAIAEFREALRINPKDAEASENLGNALLDQGHTQEAIAQYRETLRMDPASAKACYDLGGALQKLGQTDEAAARYRDALRINPAYTDARNNLGILLMQQGRAPEGIAEFRTAVRHDPASGAAHMNLGKALLQQKQTGEAVAEFDEVARLNPSDAGAEFSLAGVLMRLGRTQEAIAHLQKALDLQPANANLQNNLAWLLATAPQPSLRDGTRAVQLATQASRTTGGNNPLVLRTLAAAYAEAGDFSNAAQTAQNALQLAGAQSNAALADALRRELTLYQAGRKYEEAR